MPPKANSQIQQQAPQNQANVVNLLDMDAPATSSTPKPVATGGGDDWGDWGGFSDPVPAQQPQ